MQGEAKAAGTCARLPDACGLDWREGRARRRCHVMPCLACALKAGHPSIPSRTSTQCCLPWVPPAEACASTRAACTWYWSTAQGKWPPPLGSKVASQHKGRRAGRSTFQHLPQGGSSLFCKHAPLGGAFSSHPLLLLPLQRHAGRSAAPLCQAALGPTKAAGARAQVHIGRRWQGRGRVRCTLQRCSVEVLEYSDAVVTRKLVVSRHRPSGPGSTQACPSLPSPAPPFTCLPLPSPACPSSNLPAPPFAQHRPRHALPPLPQHTAPRPQASVSRSGPLACRELWDVERSVPAPLRLAPACDCLQLPVHGPHPHPHSATHRHRHHHPPPPLSPTHPPTTATVPQQHLRGAWPDDEDRRLWHGSHPQ